MINWRMPATLINTLMTSPVSLSQSLCALFKYDTLIEHVFPDWGVLGKNQDFHQTGVYKIFLKRMQKQSSHKKLFL